VIDAARGNASLRSVVDEPELSLGLVLEQMALHTQAQHEHFVE